MSSKKNNFWVFALQLLILIAVVIFGIKISGSGSNNNEVEKSDNENEKIFDIVGLSKCLSEKNWKMYGVNDCIYCQQQKKMFGSAFENVNYINCQFEKELCVKNEINKYPVWEGNGKKFPGVYNLEKLATLSGCSAQTK